MPQRRVTNRFMELLAAKIRREGRKITITEVVETTGLARATVDGYVHNTITRYDAHVIKVLCDYFACQPGDLLVIEEVEGQHEMTAQRLAVAS